MEFYRFLLFWVLIAAVYSHSPVQQNIQLAPPVPIIQLSQDYILNQTLSIVQPNSSHVLQTRRGSSLVPGSTSHTYNPLFKRDAEPCAVGSPCPDGRFVIQSIYLNVWLIMLSLVAAATMANAGTALRIAARAIAHQIVKPRQCVGYTAKEAISNAA